MIEVLFDENAKDGQFLEYKNERLFSEYQKIALTAHEVLDLRGGAEVEVSFFLPKEIQELNLTTRGVDKVTDVLSYPALSNIKEFSKNNYPFDFDEETGKVFLGSIVICVERAIEQAHEFGHGVEREMKYLFIHGLLHLLGYDHETENDKRVMREFEELILKKADNQLEKI